MARAQTKSKRKATGGRYVAGRSKRRSELTRLPTHTKLAENKIKSMRVIGGNPKKFLLAANAINVSDAKGKVAKVELTNVVENKANPHLVRRNILTKGAIVETKLGKVRVTSRPGQNAVLSGVLVK
jgi:small subunit ribosomal protein S8e